MREAVYDDHAQRYTVIVQTKSVDLFERECFVIRHARDFENLTAAREYAQAQRDEWLDPTTRVRVVDNTKETI